MNDLTFDADFLFVLFRVLSCRCLTCRVGRNLGKFSALQGDLDLSSLFWIALIGLASNYAKLNNCPQSIDFSSEKFIIHCLSLQNCLQWFWSVPSGEEIMSCFSCCVQDDIRKASDNGPFVANNSAGKSVYPRLFLFWGGGRGTLGLWGHFFTFNLLEKHVFLWVHFDITEFQDSSLDIS